MESLEGRELLSLTFTVSNPAGDHSDNTLYWAITQANEAEAEDTSVVIEDTIANITLTMALPTITWGVTITPELSNQVVTITDQTGENDSCGLDVNISELKAERDVTLNRLTFTGFDCALHVARVGDLSANDCDFDYSEEVGVLFDEADLGSTPPEDVDVGSVSFVKCSIQHNGGDGFRFFGQAEGLTLSSCTITHNTSNGVRVHGDPDVSLNGGIGGSLYGDIALIHSNGQHGIYLEGCKDFGVGSCYIGTDEYGTLLDNGECGIYLAEGTNHCNIGGYSDLGRNIIHDAGGTGKAALLLVDDATTCSNTIKINDFVACGSDDPVKFVDSPGHACQHAIPAPHLGSPQYTEWGTWRIPVDAATFPAFFEDNWNVTLQAYFTNDNGDWIYADNIWNLIWGVAVDYTVAAWEDPESDIEFTLPSPTSTPSLAGYDHCAVMWTCTAAPSWDTSMFSNIVPLFPVTEVVGRHVFYEGSYLEGEEEEDDDAIDWTKSPLLSDTAPVTAANITGYSKGLNGIMIDIDEIGNPGGITADDFEFDMGTGGNWTSADSHVASVSVGVGEGESGSDRITIKFTDSAIKDTWLRTKIKSNADTGLGAEDTFYFGNLAGDTNCDRVVNNTDLNTVRANWGQSGKLISTGDVNLDDIVNSGDLDVLRASPGTLGLPSGAKSLSAMPTKTAAASATDAFFSNGLTDERPKREVDSDVLAMLAAVKGRQDNAGVQRRDRNSSDADGMWRLRLGSAVEQLATETPSLDGDKTSEFEWNLALGISSGGLLLK